MKEEYKEWCSQIEAKIINEEDKAIIKEIIACAINDCNRAAYILCWISLIESLKRKLHQFSNLGDKNSEEAIKKIEEAESQKNSTDKLIYEKALECGIIDNNDYSIIGFLWEQRCIFAHPYEKKPDIDELKHIMTQSVKISLGKELLFSKTYISELSNNIVDKPFFIPNQPEKIEAFAQKIISRTPESLYPFFFKTLLFKLGSIKDDESKIYELKKVRIFIIELFKTTKIGLDDARWGLESRTTNFPYESFLGFVHPDIWLKIPERLKEMLISYFEFEQIVQKLFILKAITKHLIANNVLEEKYRSRYFKKLDTEPFDSAIEYYGDPKTAFTRIIAGLDTSNYEIQNPIIDYLKTDKAISMISGLDEKKKIDIGRRISLAVQNNNWKSQYLVNGIENKHYVFPSVVIIGIIIGYLFSPQNSFRYGGSYDHINRAFKFIRLLDENAIKILTDEIEKLFADSQAQDWEKDLFDEDGFTTQIDIYISEIVWEGDADKYMAVSIRDLIKNYFA